MNGRSEINPTKLHQKGCEYGRRTRRMAVDNRADIGDIVESLQDRPSWTVLVMITLMSNIITALSVAFITS